MTWEDEAKEGVQIGERPQGGLASASRKTSAPRKSRKLRHIIRRHSISRRSSTSSNDLGSPIRKVVASLEKVLHLAGSRETMEEPGAIKVASEGSSRKVERWRQELIDSIRTVDKLREYVALTPEEEEKLPIVLRKFQMGITPYYADLIDPHDPDDPLKKLVVPSVDELREGGQYDTSGEADNVQVRGLQHKYRNTVLLLPTSVCASYCRYCFRKRFTTGSISKQETGVDWEGTLGYLRRHREVDNVLITGGDPLMLVNEKLDFILSQLRTVDHIKIIRLGTKLPAFNPFRILDDGFLELIKRYSLPDRRIYIVAHYDHPRELTAESLECLDKAIKAGAHIINQAVLHRGINDDPDVLRELFRRLADAGVAPYYLFQMRPVKGSLHYRVPIAEGLRIFEESKKGLGGLARTVRYAMSHYTGKIEIFGTIVQDEKENLILKYHSCRDEEDVGKIFTVPLNDEACWLDDFFE